MSQFQIGDRVGLIKRTKQMGPERGQIGTVCGVFLSGLLPYLVDFDHSFHCGHTGDGSARGGHGWYCLAEELELLKENDAEQIELSVHLEEVI